MRLRWFELRPLLKAVLVTGVAVGRAGLVGGVGLLVQAILAGQATFSLTGSWLYIIVFLATLLLAKIIARRLSQGSDTKGPVGERFRVPLRLTRVTREMIER